MEQVSMIVASLAMGGGLFAVLTFIHFFVDWIFQTHSEAMIKHNHPWIRAKHCAIYTAGFLPFFWLCGFTTLEWVFSVNLLFWSHFIEDTYFPVFLWAKYIRRPPQMTEPQKIEGLDGYVRVEEPDAKKGFVQFIETPIGKILMISIDQIIHLAFLWPIAWLALGHL